MRQALHRLMVETRGRGFTDVTGLLAEWLAAEGVGRGLLTVWCRHTSASLVVQENADPDVRADLEAFFRRLVPEAGSYRHAEEGPDDMPAHIRAALTLTQISVPVEDARLALGTWQAIYLFEHRASRRRLELVSHLIGERCRSAERLILGRTQSRVVMAGLSTRCKPAWGRVALADKKGFNLNPAVGAADNPFTAVTYNLGYLFRPG